MPEVTQELMHRCKRYLRMLVNRNKRATPEADAKDAPAVPDEGSDEEVSVGALVLRLLLQGMLAKQACLLWHG